MVSPQKHKIEEQKGQNDCLELLMKKDLMRLCL